MKIPCWDSESSWNTKIAKLCNVRRINRRSPGGLLPIPMKMSLPPMIIRMMGILHPKNLKRKVLELLWLALRPITWELESLLNVFLLIKRLSKMKLNVYSKSKAIIFVMGTLLMIWICYLVPILLEARKKDIGKRLQIVRL